MQPTGWLRTIGCGIGLPAACALVAAITLQADSSAVAQDPDSITAALSLERALVDVIARTEKSVVSIARVRLSQQTRERPEFNPFGLDMRAGDFRRDQNNPESPDFIPNEFGSGIIVAPEESPDERYILTNYHVVRDGPVAGPRPPTGDTRLFVWFAGGRNCEVSIFAADPRSDLAVLKIEYAQLGLQPSDLQPLKFRTETTPLPKGTLAISLGNPYAIVRDGTASASWGMVSNISRRPAPPESPLDETALNKETLHHLGTLLQVDTRLNLGTSGGALVNLRGELIGITTSLAALKGYEQSVGYAVPIDGVTRRIIGDLCRGYEVEYGFLGLMPENVVPDEMRRRAPDLGQATAAKVVSIIPASPAADARLLRDDWVLAVNGETVRNRADLMRLVGQLAPESPAKLRIWRSRTDSELTLTVKLAKWPVFDDEGIIATVPRYPEWRGIDVDYPTGRRRYFDWPLEFNEAVVIVRVAPGSKGEAAGLHDGDFITRVNGEPVRTPAEFHKAVSGQQDDVSLDLVGNRRVVVKK